MDARRFSIFSLILLVVLAACSSDSVPRATPTVRPSSTPNQGTPIAQEPSRTPLLTATDLPTSTATITASATVTASATIAPSETQSPQPSATQTLTETPTRTPSRTPVPSDTPTPTATDTARPSPLPLINDPTETLTPTLTATDTPRPTDTPTETPTPRPTNTPDPTATDAPTATPTDTATPEPTNTPEPTVTEAPTTTPRPSTTPIPTLMSLQDAQSTLSARQTDDGPTSTPTQDLTAIAEAVFATQTAFPLTQTAEANATATAAAASPTTNPFDIQLTETQIALALTPQPTLNVTPTFITATPGAEFTLTPPPEDLGIIPPAVVDETVEGFASATPESTATIVFPTSPPVLAPPTVSFDWQQQIAAQQTGNNAAVSVVDYTVGAVVAVPGASIGVSIGGEGILPLLVARNPVTGVVARTSQTGALYVNEAVPSEPFSPYVGSVGSPAENDYFVSAVAWSGNGQYLAFVVDGGLGGHPDPTAEDGVHIFNPETGEYRQVVVDCPYEGHQGCLLGGSRDYLGKTTEVHWSPGGTRLIARQRLNADWAQSRDVGRLLIVPNRPGQHASACGAGL